MGQIELEPRSAAPAEPRFRLPFDPVFDLRSCGRRTPSAGPWSLPQRDFLTLLGLQQAFQARQMDEALLPILDRLAALHPINPTSGCIIAQADELRSQFREKLGPAPSTSPGKTWGARRDRHRPALPGRAATAAEILERAYPAGQGSLGRHRPDRDPPSPPGRAREGTGLWQQATHGAPARGPRRPGRGDLSRRGTSRRGENRIRKGSCGRSQPVRGPVWPGHPRAGCRPRAAASKMPAPRSIRPRTTWLARRPAPWLPASPSSLARKRAGR